MCRCLTNQIKYNIMRENTDDYSVFSLSKKKTEKRMYYYIKGKPVIKGLNYVVVEAGGVGYKINSSANSLSAIGDNDKEITVYTHFVVREDAQELFGFITLEEKNMFESLISVSGVGPKAAISILSVTTPSEFAAAVICDNVKVITKAQGVGPKLAKRVILELRDKMKNIDIDLPADSGMEEIAVASDARNEAVSALVVLGYSADEAKKAVLAVDGDMSVEEYVKKALVRLF